MSRPAQSALFTFLFLTMAGCSGVSSTQTTLEEAERLLAQGDWPRAIATFDLVLSVDAQNVRALGGRGRALIETGQHDAAIESFSKAINISPEDSSLLLLRGDSLLWGKLDPTSAFSDYCRALDLDSTSSEARFGVVFAGCATGRIPQSVDELTSELRTNAQALAQYAHWSDRWLRLYDEWYSDVEEISEIILRLPSAKAFVERAQLLSSDNGVFVRVLDLTAALAMSEQPAPILEKRADQWENVALVCDLRTPDQGPSVWQEAHDLAYQRAAEDCSTLLQTTNDRASVLRRRAYYYYQANFNDLALRDLDELIRPDKQDPRDLSLRASILEEMGDLDSSRRDLDQAIALRTRNNPNDYITRGMARLRENDAEGAIADFTVAIDSLSPYDSNVIHSLAYRMRSIAYQRRGLASDALVDLTQAIAASEGDWTPDFLVRAELLFSLNKRSEAFADIDSAIRIKPESALAFFQLARLYYLMGDLAQSKTAMNRAVSLDPRFAGRSLDKPLDFLDESR